MFNSGFIFLFPIALYFYCGTKHENALHRLGRPHLLNAAVLESDLIPTQPSVQLNLKRAA